MSSMDSAGPKTHPKAYFLGQYLAICYCWLTTSSRFAYLISCVIEPEPVSRLWALLRVWVWPVTNVVLLPASWSPGLELPKLLVTHGWTIGVDHLKMVLETETMYSS